MKDKNKQKRHSSKKPKQKFPIDSKIPRQKSPSDKIPKQRIGDDSLLPPKRQRSRKESSAPSKSRLKQDEIRKSNKGIEKERIVTKKPKGERFVDQPKQSKGIPKQKIPKTKIPQQDKLEKTKERNIIPDDSESRKKEKKESTPPRRENFREIKTLDSKALEKTEREKRESSPPPSNNKDQFSETEKHDSRTVPKEEKVREKREREAPVTREIEEKPKHKQPTQKIPSQKYPQQTKKPKQKKPR